MEYLVGFYLVGVVLTSLFLVVALTNKPVKGLTGWQTFFLAILTSIIWPVFVGHAFLANRN
jgi:hypothetical protein